ncbi:MAG: acyltransferase [Bacteroidetes bacterium]|nr:acyltransferase [Bacteroidota bacterium]
MNSLKSNRSPIPDLLKGYAVLFMIQVHILELFIDKPGQESWVGRTSLFLGGPFAAPVFMIIMGYFISKGKLSLFHGIFRGIKIFILGLLLNIGLNFHLLVKIISGDLMLNPLEYIWGIDIFFLAGSSIIILSLLKSIIKRKYWIILILILLISIGTHYINQLFSDIETDYFLPLIGGEFTWSYFPLFPWLAYPLIGFLFYKWEDKIVDFRQKNKLVFWFAILGVFILLVVFLDFGFNSSIKLNYYYHHQFHYMLWAIGLVILWTLLLEITAKYLNVKVRNFITWMGINVTAIYVVQWLIIGNVSTAIYQTQKIETFGFWFAIILFFSISFAYLYHKLTAKSREGSL